MISISALDVRFGIVRFLSGTRLLALGLAALLLGGCAAQRLHDEGISLLEEGRVEEGLAKLTEATKADPQDLSYRAALLRNRDMVVARMIAAANSERAADRPDAAQAIYERILRISPESPRAKAGLDELAMDKRHEAALEQARALLKTGSLEAARAALKPVLIENPRNGKATALQRQIDEVEARELRAGPALGAQFRKPVSLQFRDANLKMVFEALSRTSGVNILLDKDIKPDLKTSIFVKDVSVQDTIDLILLQNQLAKKVISDNTVFVYPNTPAKTKDYEDLKIRSFHLTNADPKQVLTMLKTLLKTKDIFIHEKTNSIVMRDTPDAIRLAEKLVADQDIAEPEVMLELEVLEISRTLLTDLGIKWPDTLSLSSTATATGSDGSSAPALTFGQLKNLALNDYLASQIGVTLNLKLTDSNANLLASPRIRARNREKAKVLIGDRVPIITNAVTPLATGTPVVTGSVQYLDVGLKLEVEPDVHLDNEVAIKVNLEVSSLVDTITQANGTTAYRIGTRTASTVLRLRDGETQVLAGLINDSDRKSAAKVPGLGQLPILGRLFSSHSDDKQKTEIVLSITPRIVSGAKVPDAREVEYWAGTEATLRSNPLMLRPLGTVAANSSGAAAGTPAASRGRPARTGPAVPSPAPAAQTAPAAAGTPPLALSWQGPSQAKVGERITLTISTQSAQELGSLGFLLSYDPQVLKAVEAAEGDFLKQKNLPTSFSQSIDQAGGQVLIDLTGEGAEGVAGRGSVATVTFEVLAAAPQSQIAVSRIVPAGPDGEALAFTVPEPHSLAVVQ